MKKNIFNKILNLIKVAFFLCILLIQFFGFVFKIPISSAAECRFVIKSLEAQPANVIRTDTLKFYAQVDQEGLGPVCDRVKDVRFRFFVPERSSAGRWLGSNVGGYFIDQAVSFAGKNSVIINGQSDAKWQFNLNEFSGNWNSLPNPNKFEYALSVIPENFGYGNVEEVNTVDWNKTVNVSGETGGAGNKDLVDISITFDKSIVSPQTTNLKIYANVKNSDLSKLPSKVAMLTYLNDKQVGNNYGTVKTGIDKSQLLSNQTFQELTNFTTNSGFKNEANSIRVDIQDAQSPYRLYARGLGTLQATGFGSGGGAGAGKKYACKDGDGVYICGTKADLSDLKVEDYVSGGECDTYKSSFGQVDSSSCGKTDDEIKSSTPPGEKPAEPSQAPKPIDCTKDKDSRDCIYNPLPTDDLTSTFLLIVKGLLSIVGIWAVMFIIVGGFRMVVSAGNEEAVTQAKKTITWAVLGAAAALLSFSIINIVQNLLHSAVR